MCDVGVTPGTIPFYSSFRSINLLVVEGPGAGERAAFGIEADHCGLQPPRSVLVRIRFDCTFAFAETTTQTKVQRRWRRFGKVGVDHDENYLASKFVCVLIVVVVCL